MSKYTTTAVTVEWDRGMATGFASKQEAERFIEHICMKTAPHLDYSIYSNTGLKSPDK